MRSTPLRLVPALLILLSVAALPVDASTDASRTRNIRAAFGAGARVSWTGEGGIRRISRIDLPMTAASMEARAVTVANRLSEIQWSGVRFDVPRVTVETVAKRRLLTAPLHLEGRRVVDAFLTLEIDADDTLHAVRVGLDPVARVDRPASILGDDALLASACGALRDLHPAACASGTPTTHPVWYRTRDGSLKPAGLVRFVSPTFDAAWETLVDASTGEVLWSRNRAVR
jgi:hypothetical protein